MDLILDNKKITTPIIDIIKRLRIESNKRIFTRMDDKGDYISTICPFHKDGNERHPSFSIYKNYDNKDLRPGTYHCFTCNEKGKLEDLVSYALDLTYDDAKYWLIDNYADTFLEDGLVLPVIDLNQKNNNFLDESVLNNFRYIHPYILKRGVSEEIVKKFLIGYNKDTNSITFPIRDEYGNLLGITERSVENKRFKIPHDIVKPIYLLNEVVNKGYPYVVICEAQIDALVCWSFGVPAVAMLGTGSKEQYDVLNKYNINWITMFDNDYAGRQATERFNRNIRKDVMVVNLFVPNPYKDIGDINKDIFDKLLNENNLTWRL